MIDLILASLAYIPYHRRANAEARVYWFPAADVAKFWSARLRAIDLVRNVRAQQRSRFTSDRTLEVLIVSALVGSALTSRPEISRTGAMSGQLCYLVGA